MPGCTIFVYFLGASSYPTTLKYLCEYGTKFPGENEEHEFPHGNTSTCIKCSRSKEEKTQEIMRASHLQKITE